MSTLFPFRTLIDAQIMNGTEYQGLKRIVFEGRKNRKPTEIPFSILFEVCDVKEFNNTQDRLMIIQTDKGWGYIHEYEYPIGDCTIDTESVAKVFENRDREWFISLGLTEDLRVLAKPWIESLKNE